MADEEARHLQALIDDAVDMARLESNHIQVRRELTDPKELMEDVVASLHTQIDNRPVEIRAEESLPQLSLDRRLLKLALKQVLDNALKYSPPRSPVTVHRVQWPRGQWERRHQFRNHRPWPRNTGTGTEPFV